MRHANRLVLGGFAGPAMALVLASTALAAGPVTVVTHPTGTFIDPAGTGCPFDIQVLRQDSTKVTTTYPDGTVLTATSAEPRFTNLANGVSVTQVARYVDVARVDTASNTVTDVAVGSFNENFYPGDQGPYGLVGGSGLFLHMVGETSETDDLDSGAILHFTLHGVVTANICAELSH